MPFVDFREVRRLVPIAKVLELIGYKSVGIAEKSVYGPCPLSCCSSLGKRFYRRCCSVDLESNVWFCHACKRGGHQLDLYALAKNLTVYEAATRLCVATGVWIPYIGVDEL